MITSIFGFLVYSYFVLYSLLSFLWLKLNRYLDHNIFTKDRPNNIVIIGDSLAAGFGDWITTGVNGGLASRLKKYLAEDESLVLPWKVWNCGHFAATSDEWHPDALTGPMYMAWTVGWRQLFDSVFGEKAGRTKDAKIVVLAVGSFDCRRTIEGREIEFTKRNIHAIAERLVEMGKYVIICSLLDIRYKEDSAREKSFMGRHQYKNSAIYAMTKEFSGTVFEGTNLTHVNFLRPRCLDGIHLNTEGYNLMAEEICPIIKQTILRVQLDLAANNKQNPGGKKKL